MAFKIPANMPVLASVFCADSGIPVRAPSTLPATSPVAYPLPIPAVSLAMSFGVKKGLPDICVAP